MNLRISFPFYLCFLMLTVTSCDQKSKELKEKEDLMERAAQNESDIEISTINAEAMNESASAILDFRYKEHGMESYAIIEMDRWEYEFIARGADIKPAGNGMWIDFLPDLTYTYGDNDGQMGAGKYHYNFEDHTLLVVDNNKSIKPQEWEAKIAGPTMVLVGKATYRDNHLQVKLAQHNVPK